jgi:hypothetical protein
MNKTQVRQQGYKRGYGIATNIATFDIGEYIDGNLSPEIGRIKVTSANWLEVHTDLAYSAEYSDREYSPFECLALDLNKLSDSDKVKFEPWNEFEEAIGRGIAKALRERYKAVCRSKYDYCKTFNGSIDLFEACWRKLRKYAKSSIELDFNESSEVERWLEELSAEFVNDSSSRFYIYG